MIRAIKGALDYVINDISPAENEVPYFLDLIGVFRDNVGSILYETLP